MTQLTYDEDLAIGIPGQLYDLNPKTMISAVSEEATAFPFGKAVVRGTDPDKQALLPTGTGELLGVASHSHAAENDLPTADSIQDERVFNVVHDGRLYVQVEEAVTPASSVFVRVSAGGLGLGSFRASDPGGSAALACSNARYIGSAGINGIVALEIDKGATLS